MSTKVAVTLPDDLLRHAQLLAALSGKSIDDVLAETIELSLRPLGEAAGDAESADDWSDDEVLAAADLKMPPQEDRRRSALLKKNQRAAMTPDERAELRELMSNYQVGLLKKAAGLRQAVLRGLRPPLEP